MIPPTCRVVREGTIKNLPAADLVKGDVVLLVSLPPPPTTPMVNGPAEYGV